MFLIYINDLHRAINHSTTYNFADDTHLLNISENYKKLEQNVNRDLKSLYQWLVANKISLNKDKTELIIFQSNKPPPILKIKLNGKCLSPSKMVKYLGIYLDETLSGEAHTVELIKKLNRANGMLAKIRHFVPKNISVQIYHSIFASHLTYGCQVWSQKLCSVRNQVSVLQKNAIRLITFSHHKAPSEPLFKNLGILKFEDILFQHNCLFVHDFLKGNLPLSFNDTFKRINEKHTIKTRNANIGMLSTERYHGVTFGNKSIYANCIKSWNKFTLINNEKDKIIDLIMFSRNKLKSLIKDFFMNKYETYIPADWFQTNCFVSQTLEENGNFKITISKCHTFRTTEALNEGFLFKICWGDPLKFLTNN